MFAENIHDHFFESFLQIVCQPELKVCNVLIKQRTEGRRNVLPKTELIGRCCLGVDDETLLTRWNG